jgi:hypothetical protein
MRIRPFDGESFYQAGNTESGSYKQLYHFPGGFCGDPQKLAGRRDKVIIAVRMDRRRNSFVIVGRGHMLLLLHE